MCSRLPVETPRQNRSRPEWVQTVLHIVTPLRRCIMQAHLCITACQEAGARVLHSVDASQLQDHFGAASFQRIVFNFPHTGHQRVHINRALVSSFFASAR